MPSYQTVYLKQGIKNGEIQRDIKPRHGAQEAETSSRVSIPWWPCGHPQGPPGSGPPGHDRPRAETGLWRTPHPGPGATHIHSHFPTVFIT